VLEESALSAIRRNYFFFPLADFFGAFFAVFFALAIIFLIFGFGN